MATIWMGNCRCHSEIAQTCTWPYYCFFDLSLVVLREKGYSVSFILCAVIWLVNYIIEKKKRLYYSSIMKNIIEKN